MHQPDWAEAQEEAGQSAPPSATIGEIARRAWIDRDTSWLEFNRRVLHEALDDRTPLLERAKFLAIFSSNLDEFFMKRVSLIRVPSDDSSLSAQDRHDKQLVLRELIVSMLAEQAACYTNVIRPQLSENGIHLLDWNELSDEQKATVSAVFDTEISPVLTPLSSTVHIRSRSSRTCPRPGRSSSSIPRTASGARSCQGAAELPQWLRARASAR